MIITRTPMRISFFGGGTDFKEFYQEYGGAVLSTSFDKYCYVTVRHLPRFLIMSQSSVTVILSVSAVRMISVIH